MTQANHRQHLVTPFFSRPAEPTGDLALYLARVREQRERWVTPIPDEVAPPSACGMNMRAMGRNGVRIQGRTGRPRSVTPEQEVWIVELRSDGRTVREIVAMVGCTDGCVRHVLATARED